MTRRLTLALLVLALSGCRVEISCNLDRSIDDYECSGMECPSFDDAKRLCENAPAPIASKDTGSEGCSDPYLKDGILTKDCWSHAASSGQSSAPSGAVKMR